MTEKSRSNLAESEVSNIIDLPVITSESPPVDLKALSPYNETLDDIISSWNLDEPLNFENFDEASTAAVSLFIVLELIFRFNKILQ